MKSDATNTPSAHSPSPADPERMRRICGIVEGVYILTEWRDGGVMLDPATINARLVIQNGMLIWVANHFQKTTKLGYSGIGAYCLTENRFSYGYQQLITAITDETGDRIDRSMPDWAVDMALPAMRDFALAMQGDQATLTNKGGVFEMRPDGCVYTDLNTDNVRVWKKLGHGE